MNRPLIVPQRLGTEKTKPIVGQACEMGPQVPRTFGQKACCDVVNRGVAVYKGKVYVGTLDGRLAGLPTCVHRPRVLSLNRGRCTQLTG